MQLSKSIRDNLHFLIAEVDSQVSNLHSCIETTSPIVAQHILDRSGYAYNLKMRIHDSCLAQISRCKIADAQIQALRAAESIATSLERIAELCRDCVHQMGYIKEKRCLRSARYAPLLAQISRGIALVEPAINGTDTERALKIGRIEHKLDRGYRKLLKRYISLLKKRKHAEDLISALFVAHSVEQMGDALLVISEAIISVNLGQPINIDRYFSLMESVGQLEKNGTGGDLTIESVAETRSGSGISGVSSSNGGDEGYVAIFKDGKKRKLKEEREGVESWHEIYPGLAPRILSWHKRGKSAAMLIEHLAGLTFEEIVMHEPEPQMNQALRQLGKTLKSVWRETRTDQHVSAQYMRQLSRRLPEVYDIHPEFRQADARICGLDVPSFDTLLERTMALEAGLEAPFSVYIHGDFNVDNIIYDPAEKRINFIDLHRSRYMDYVQDVSVFMVSNYRLQVLDAPIRQRISGLTRDFYRFARKYAKKTADDTFEQRLALGLVRSFASSTRFILDRTLSRAMFLRARFLMERLLEAAPDRATTFRVPVEEIFVG